MEPVYIDRDENGFTRTIEFKGERKIVWFNNISTLYFGEGCRDCYPFKYIESSTSYPTKYEYLCFFNEYDNIATGIPYESIRICVGEKYN